MADAPSMRIALALSGGGSRAIAFHLGCLRALHQGDLLNQVTVMSSVSGGSVLAALYCSRAGDFDSFEREARALLARGLVRPALINAVTSVEGASAAACFLTLAVDRTAAWLIRGVLLPIPSIRRRLPWLRRAAIPRWASRTTVLRRTLDHIFDGRALSELRQDRPRLIVIACELRAKAAIYFTKDRIQCWRYGYADSAGVSIAHAVTASAAYPLILPALDTSMEFTKDDVSKRQRITLTDGGVYDNLGLAPFWPDRNPSISMSVDSFDRIIACRAGYGLEVGESANFLPSRMMAVFESIHARVQNFAQTRLFDLAAAKRIGGFLLPYLGQDDDRLARPPSDLVRREEVQGYPTDFSAMSEEWIGRLCGRGETLVRALLAEHWADVN